MTINSGPRSLKMKDAAAFFDHVCVYARPDADHHAVRRLSAKGLNAADGKWHPSGRSGHQRISGLTRLAAVGQFLLFLF